MNRREILKTGIAAGILGATGTDIGAAESSNHFYELRTYELRNDLKPARIQEFFQQHFVPLMKRAGAGPVGCFNVISGMYAPSLVVLIGHQSLGSMQTMIERAAADKDFVADRRDAHWSAPERRLGGETGRLMSARMAVDQQGFGRSRALA